MELLIVKTGSTVELLKDRLAADFEDWFRDGLGLDAARAPCVDVTTPDGADSLPAPEDVPAAIVTGSPSMVTAREPWSERCAEWLARVVEAGRPVLGVCYGHQLLAQALGGRVGDNPNGREIGTVEVRLLDRGAEDPLLGGLGEPAVFQATHVQSVLEPPPGARVLARNDHDACQVFAYGRCAWGVQFHPEFDAAIVRGYLEARAEALRAEGLDPGVLAERTRDSDHGRRLLQRYRRLAKQF